MRMCTTCRRCLPIEAMGRDRSRPDGVAARCLECARAYSREWRARNPERARAHQHSRDREKVRRTQREWVRRKRAIYGDARVSDVRAAVKELLG